VDVHAIERERMVVDLHPQQGIAAMNEGERADLRVAMDRVPIKWLQFYELGLDVPGPGDDVVGGTSVRPTT
jgi:hypothetical protein